MAHALRDKTTPLALAQSRQVIDFEGRLRDFVQLSRSVGQDLDALDDGQVPPDWQDNRLQARLSFGFADGRDALPAVDGAASAQLQLMCQRCLEPFELELTTELHYLLLTSEQSAAQLGGYEVWELEKPTFRPSDLVEEALIMALPMAPMHEDVKDCGALIEGLGETSTGDSDIARPFADLRSLMKQQD